MSSSSNHPPFNLFIALQLCGNQFWVAAPCAAAAALPSSLHVVRLRQWAGGRYLLGMCSASKQTNWSGSSEFSWSASVSMFQQNLGKHHGMQSDKATQKKSYCGQCFYLIKNASKRIFKLVGMVVRVSQNFPFPKRGGGWRGRKKRLA